MLMLYLQFALFAATALILSSWFAELHLRNRRSWDAIAIKLHQSKDASSPRALFERAGVLMEAIDYVEWRTVCSDRTMIDELRRSALALRLATGKSIFGMQRRSSRG